MEFKLKVLTILKVNDLIEAFQEVEVRKNYKLFGLNKNAEGYNFSNVI